MLKRNYSGIFQVWFMHEVVEDAKNNKKIDSGKIHYTIPEKKKLATVYFRKILGSDIFSAVAPRYA